MRGAGGTRARRRLEGTVKEGAACLSPGSGRGRPIPPVVLLKGLARSAGGPPAEPAPVFRHGIAPGEVADAAVPECPRSAGLGVLASGDFPLVTTEHSADGARIEPPSKWIAAGREP